jgi:hypothetical protein
MLASFLVEGDADVQQRKRAAVGGGGARESDAHFHALRRSGRAGEFFEPQFERLKKAEEEHTRLYNHYWDIRKGNKKGNKGGAEANLAGAKDRHRRASYHLASTAHRLDHPVGQYVEGKKGRDHLSRIAAASHPLGHRLSIDTRAGLSVPTTHSIRLPRPGSKHHEPCKKHLQHSLDSHGYKHEERDGRIIITMDN